MIDGQLYLLGQAWPCTEKDAAQSMAKQLRQKGYRVRVLNRDSLPGSDIDVYVNVNDWFAQEEANA